MPGILRRAGWWWAVAVTLFWLVMMISLVHDRILPQRRAARLAERSIGPEQLARQWSDHQEYMLITKDGARVGDALTSISRVTSGRAVGFRADFSFRITLNLLGLSQKLRIAAAAELAQNFDLRRFAIQANLSFVDVWIIGLCRENDLLVEVRQGPAVKRSRFALDRQISFADAVRPIATRHFKIEPGNSIAIPVVDPLWSMQRGVLEMRVRNRETIDLGGRPVEAWRLETRLNEFVSTSWVDRQGQTLRRQLAGGFMLERPTAEQEKQMARQGHDSLTIPQLRVQDFAGLEARPLKQLADQQYSPLSVLNSAPSGK